MSQSALHMSEAARLTGFMTMNDKIIQEMNERAKLILKKQREERGEVVVQFEARTKALQASDRQHDSESGAAGVAIDSAGATTTSSTVAHAEPQTASRRPSNTASHAVPSATPANDTKNGEKASFTPGLPARSSRLWPNTSKARRRGQGLTGHFGSPRRVSGDYESTLSETNRKLEELCITPVKKRRLATGAAQTTLAVEQQPIETTTPISGVVNNDLEMGSPEGDPVKLNSSRSSTISPVKRPLDFNLVMSPRLPVPSRTLAHRSASAIGSASPSNTRSAIPRPTSPVRVASQPIHCGTRPINSQIPVFRRSVSSVTPSRITAQNPTSTKSNLPIRTPTNHINPTNYINPTNPIKPTNPTSTTSAAKTTRTWHFSGTNAASQNNHKPVAGAQKSKIPRPLSTLTPNNHHYSV